MGIGLRGGGLYPGNLWEQLGAGVWHRLIAGILVVMDPAVLLRGGYSNVVWVWGLEAGAAEGQVSHRVWVCCRAVAWCSPSGGEPCRMEQQLCRPVGQGFGRLAILLLDRGMEKTSPI
jgi:hypothetical protein